MTTQIVAHSSVQRGLNPGGASREVTWTLTPTLHQSPSVKGMHWLGLGQVMCD